MYIKIIVIIILQVIQSFATEHLKTPLGEPIKGRKNKTVAELWIEKFYKKKTNLPEPIPHELVERLEQYLDVSITASWFVRFFFFQLVIGCVGVLHYTRSGFAI